MRTALIGFYGLADEPRKTKRERVNLTAKRFDTWAKRQLLPESGLEYKVWRAKHPEYARCWVKTGWHGQVTCVEPALPPVKPVTIPTVAPSLPQIAMAFDGETTAPNALPPARQDNQARELQAEIKRLQKLLPGRLQRAADAEKLRASLPQHLR